MKTVRKNVLIITLFGNACWGTCNWSGNFGQEELQESALGRDESPTADGSSTRGSDDASSKPRRPKFNESFPDCDDKLSLEAESKILKYLSYAAVAGTLAGVIYCAYKYKTDVDFKNFVNYMATLGLDLVGRNVDYLKNLIQGEPSLEGTANALVSAGKEVIDFPMPNAPALGEGSIPQKVIRASAEVIANGIEILSDPSPSQDPFNLETLSNMEKLNEASAYALEQLKDTSKELAQFFSVSRVAVAQTAGDFAKIVGSKLKG